ncbi:hypothetical protein [Halorarius litoreus]|uniref:hypothetical protein n=1 Tax=Halorarius litoreus TaxID=2962676 RepID=UPI0020CC5579|nr:hypothetical protein [Halorarius litoreus]
MISRRAFLVAGAVTLAGCSSGATTNTPTSTPRPESTPARSTPGGSRASFATYLDRRAVTVQSLTTAAGTVSLRYVPAGEEYEELSAEVGTIAGGFLREVEAGWSVTRLDATIVADGSPVARWHVEAAWLGEYRRGEITGQELSLRILDTLERVDGTATP